MRAEYATKIQHRSILSSPTVDLREGKEKNMPLSENDILADRESRTIRESAKPEDILVGCHRGFEGLRNSP
jgi:hypothetical protein